MTPTETTPALSVFDLCAAAYEHDGGIPGDCPKCGGEMDRPSCGTCGGRGYYEEYSHDGTSGYQRFGCDDCGGMGVVPECLEGCK